MPRVVVLCRPHNPTGTMEPVPEVERFLRRVPDDTVVLLDEAYIEFVAPEHRVGGPASGGPLRKCRGAAVVLEGLWPGRTSDRLRVRVTGAGRDPLDRCSCRSAWAITSLVAVAASYAAGDQLRQRIRANHRRTALSCLGVSARWGYAPPRDTPTSFTCPPKGGSGARSSPTAGLQGPATTPTEARGSPSGAAHPRGRCWPQWQSPQPGKSAKCGKKGRGPFCIRETRSDRAGTGQLGACRAGAMLRRAWLR